jgi:hypothetical protein
MYSCGKYGQLTHAYTVLVMKPEGKGPPVRQRCRREDNVKVVLVQTGWKGVDWIDLI